MEQTKKRLYRTVVRNPKPGTFKAAFRTKEKEIIGPDRDKIVQDSVRHVEETSKENVLKASEMTAELDDPIEGVDKIDQEVNLPRDPQ